MFGRGICEKYQSRDEKFHEPNGKGNLVSRLVFFANTSILIQGVIICQKVSLFNNFVCRDEKYQCNHIKGSVQNHKSIGQAKATPRQPNKDKDQTAL